MKELKERIEKKLEENIEKILAKEELDEKDVMKLENALMKINQKSTDSEWKSTMLGLINSVGK